MTTQKRNVLVLGGSGHVGQAVTRAFVERGDDVWVTYHQNEDAAKTLAEGSDQVHLVQMDVLDTEAMQTQLEQWPEETLPTVVVHCVADASWVDLDEIDLAFWQRSMTINVTSAFVAIQALSTRWTHARLSADVVLVGAINGLLPVPSPIAFGTAQGALVSLAKTAARVLGPDDIRVNAVVFGPLDGGISDRLEARLIEDYKRFSALGRVGTATEAARLIRWLATENTAMTGSVLSADGGL